jgi:hypothetical protein
MAAAKLAAQTGIARIILAGRHRAAIYEPSAKIFKGEAR